MTKGKKKEDFKIAQHMHDGLMQRLPAPSLWHNAHSAKK